MLCVKQSVCLECGGCIALCPEEALILLFGTIEIESDLCTECCLCVNFCPVGSLEVGNE